MPKGTALRPSVRSNEPPRRHSRSGPVLPSLDEIFAKGHVVKEDEQAYAAMNGRFHDLIVGGASDPLLSDLIHRVYSVPFVAPSVVPFKRIPLEQIYPILMSGNHQHHAIVDAIEAGQPDVAETLMRGHSSPARRSLGLEGGAIAAGHE